MVVDRVYKSILTANSNIFSEGDYVEFEVVNGDDTEKVEGEIIGLSKKTIVIQREDAVCKETYSLLNIVDGSLKTV